MKGLLLVISGPSGVGKTSLVKKFLEEFKSEVIFSISCTTRKPRPGEVHGKDYFFVDQKTFEKMIEKDELLEWANVHGNYYGTLKSFVYENLLKGKSVLLDIDPHGAFQIKQKIRDSVLIFILPPSWDELKKRLQKRKSESESEIQKRLRRAREEIKFCKDYDYLIVNDRLEKAYEVLKSIYIAEKRKTCRFLNNLENEIKDPYLISLIRSEE
ncbi:MAG TPA: guanylate kinase [Desulfurobacteriaceae bacterium]|nr:guanylate kinase [Desulfurobacteriaceae bacterium]